MKRSPTFHIEAGVYSDSKFIGFVLFSMLIPTTTIHRVRLFLNFLSVIWERDIATIFTLSVSTEMSDSIRIHRDILWFPNEKKQGILMNESVSQAQMRINLFWNDWNKGLIGWLFVWFVHRPSWQDTHRIRSGRCCVFRRFAPRYLRANRQGIHAHQGKSLFRLILKYLAF